jgi:hypothetical protein
MTFYDDRRVLTLICLCFGFSTLRRKFSMPINPKKSIRLFLLTTLMTTGLLVSGSVLAHADHGKPMHGGVVAEAGAFQGELVAKARTLTLHISNHGEPVAMAGGSAKGVLLIGNQKTEMAFISTGANRLEATLPSALPQGGKAVITVKLPNGNSGALRFTLP